MFKIRELSKRCKYKYEVTYTDKFLKTNRKKFFNTLNEIDNFKNELFKQENIEQNILDNDNDQFKFKQNLNITIFEAVNLSTKHRKTPLPSGRGYKVCCR